MPSVEPGRQAKGRCLSRNKITNVCGHNVMLDHCILCEFTLQSKPGYYSIVYINPNPAFSAVFRLLCL